MVINFDNNSLNLINNMNISIKEQTNSIEKISSGLKINRASDDAANLSISQKVKLQIRALHQYSKNIQDGISLVDSVEGVLGEMTSLIHSLKESVIEFHNDANSEEEKLIIEKHTDEILNTIDSLAKNYSYNGMKLLCGDPTYGTIINIKIGDNRHDLLEIWNYNYELDNLGSEEFYIFDKTSSFEWVNDVHMDINFTRSDYGAIRNRLTWALEGVNHSKELLQAYVSKIEDSNIATQMLKFTKNKLKIHTSTKILNSLHKPKEQFIELLKNNDNSNKMVYS